MKETYRFLLYNIRYGTGSGWNFHLPLPFSGYLRKTRKNVPGIMAFIKEQKPDLVGLVEVDGGSRRSEGLCQAGQLAHELDHGYIFKSKYNNSLLTRHMPLVRSQGNAFLARDRIVSRKYHYFPRGFKQLIIEVELEGIIFFIVHLSISAKARQDQLKQLALLVKTREKPVVVGGDFNVFSGIQELEGFIAATGLKSANQFNMLTFPSRNPRWELDYIFHSPEISVDNIDVPRIRLSDHLPVVCDFSLAG
ncbi:MAG: endonuclease/exonuclease/phosphatase family protein [Desulfobacteraceae bacterium]